MALLGQMATKWTASKLSKDMGSHRLGRSQLLELILPSPSLLMQLKQMPLKLISSMVVRLLSLRWIRPVNRWVSQVVFRRAHQKWYQNPFLFLKKLPHRFQNHYQWAHLNQKKRLLLYQKRLHHHFPNQLVHLSQKKPRLHWAYQSQKMHQPH